MADKFVILVVDDNANNRFTLRALLHKLPDVEVLEADSGERALIQTIEQPVHLILLDVQMPVMDGFETARHLQMTEQTRHIPIVFVTAVFKSEAFIARGYRIGAVDYLTKPIDDNLLLNRVKLYQRLFSHQHELEQTIDLLQAREQELLALKDAAEAANRAKSVFLSNMNHELRTPLNAILGFSQLLERDTSLTQSQKVEVNTITRAGKHLLALINDVLEISRIEAGRTELHKESFDLIDTLDTVKEIIRGRAEAKNLSFRVEFNGVPPRYVQGDASRLRQILINLLGNAVKFTDSGEVLLRVNREGNDRIGFTIRDTGPGISGDDQNRLFHAFYQTELGIAKGEGSGLGLIISHEFVRLMGGEIIVHSEPGQGCTFSFSLLLPEDQKPGELEPRQRILCLAANQPQPRILVVEDDEDSCRLISCLLESAGFLVQAVGNGQEAIAVFQDWRPHLIWMDMRMPVMDGYEATQRIRALEGGDNVKIVALTASVFKEECSGILAAGCDDLLFKPIEEQRLFEVMGRLLTLAYCYESEQPSESAAATVDLGLLPEPLQAELEAAAEQLDLEALLSITKEMSAYPEVVLIINEWVASFRFDLLLNALKKSG